MIYNVTLSVNGSGCILFNDSSSLCTAPANNNNFIGLGSAGHVGVVENSTHITYDSVDNFYWNQTSHRLGIGTMTPQQKLDVMEISCNWNSV